MFTPQAGPSRLHSGPHTGLDHATRLADIASLYNEQQDAESERATGTVSDVEFARRLFADETRRVSIIANDRLLAESLDVGNQANLQRDGFARDERRPTNTQTTTTWTGWFLSLFKSNTEPAPSRSWAQVLATRPLSTRLTGHDCVICQDPIRGIEIPTPCGHYYDKTCMISLFEASTKDESLFPPRCCRQTIPLARVQPHLTSATIQLFDEKTREFGTLKRVYCARPTCSRFLGPQTTSFFFASSIYTCPSPGCMTKTCSGCKAKVESTHPHSCNRAQDGERQVLALGRASGWARCPGCATLIELNMGCYHMTCRCKTQFCYLCKARWKSCGCPQWDERRLMLAAEERVDQRLGHVRRDPPVVRAPPALERAQAPPVPVRVRAPPAPAPTPVRSQAPPGLARVTSHDPLNVLLNERRAIEPARAPRHVLRANSTTVPLTAENIRRAGLHTLTRTVNVNPQGNGDVSRQATVHRTPVRTVNVNPQGNGDVSRQATVHRTPVRTVNVNPQGNDNVSRQATVHRPPVRVAHVATPTPDRVRPKSIDRDRLVREAMAELRVNHECDHTRWTYRHGEGHCQHCSDWLRVYLFKCSSCNTLACRRCRQNRL